VSLAIAAVGLVGIVRMKSANRPEPARSS
jgi:hypothetical protein